MSLVEGTGPGSRTTDEQQLHELGYAQQLHRGMGWFSDFAVSSVISNMTGGITAFYLGLLAGGPRTVCRPARRGGQ